MARYEATYGIGEKVYLLTDLEQRERLVTGIEFTAGGGVIYFLSHCLDTSRHYEMEISATVNEALRLGIEINMN